MNLSENIEEFSLLLGGILLLIILYGMIGSYF